MTEAYLSGMALKICKKPVAEYAEAELRKLIAALNAHK